MNIRKTAVAGQFYNGNSKSLENEIKGFLEGSKVILPEKVHVHSVIVPHAGYVYSGRIAAITMNEAAKKKYRCIIILAPSHYVGFSGVALPNYDYCDTPFGEIKVAQELKEKLSSEYFINEDRAHTKEHAMEVQLPLIKYIFPDTSVFPLICGQLSSNMYGSIVSDLCSLFADDILFVISSDFTHFGRAFGYLPFTTNVKEKLTILDGKAIEYILHLNSEGFSNYLSQTGDTICGAIPITLMLKIFEKLHTTEEYHAKLIKYATSGEMTGDYSHSVSYAGIAFYAK